MTYNKMRDTLIPTLFPNNLFGELDKFFTTLDAFDINDARLTLKGHPKGDLFINKDGNLILKLALAGYSKEQLSVNIDKNTLVVSAVKSSEDGEEPSALARREFKKTFTDFANTWDLETAEVSYKDGLLKILIKPITHKSGAVKNLEIK